MSARCLIYDDHYVLDTPQVDALLKPESLVPIIVSFVLVRCNTRFKLDVRMHFLTGLARWVSTFFSSWSSIYYMN